MDAIRLTITICFIFSLLVIGVCFSLYYIYFNPTISCLEEIAKDYCEGEGLYFISAVWNWNVGYMFYYKEDIRSIDREEYGFLKEEIKECKR